MRGHDRTIGGDKFSYLYENAMHDWNEWVTSETSVVLHCQSPKLASSEHSFTSSGPSYEKKICREDELAGEHLLAAKNTGCEEGTTNILGSKQEPEEIQEIVDGISSDDSKLAPVQVFSRLHCLKINRG